MAVACELIEPVLLLVIPPEKYVPSSLLRTIPPSWAELIVPLLVMPPVNVDTLMYMAVYCASIEPLLVMPPSKLEAEISITVPVAWIEPVVLIPPRNVQQTEDIAQD